MKLEPTQIEGVILLSPPTFDDPRGSFRPLYAQRLHSQAGYTHQWAEMNLSQTCQGCIRGLHLQEQHPQAKLITVVAGSIFDIVVDLRPGPHFGRWQSFHLSADPREGPSQIYLPPGIAHGFATPDQPATITYLVSEPWQPDHERVLAWNDPTLNIPWPLTNPTLSPRDQNALPLEHFRS